MKQNLAQKNLAELAIRAIFVEQPILSQTNQYLNLRCDHYI